MTGDRRRRRTAHRPAAGHARSRRRSGGLYYDGIAQIRMDTWSIARIALAGDAGYSPGPAVGGGTAVAVLGGYVLARQLAHHDFHGARAFPATEQTMTPIIVRAREAAPTTLRELVPTGSASA